LAARAVVSADAGLLVHIYGLYVIVKTCYMKSY